MKQPPGTVRQEESHRRVLSDSIARQIAQAVSSIRYGSVEIIMHDGRLVHIEKRERIRLETLAESNPHRPKAEANHDTITTN